MNRNKLATAEQTAHALAWKTWEQIQNDRDALDKMVLDKIDEISNDAGEMAKAVIWFMDQSYDNVDLVEQAYHALAKATRGKSNEAILEAAVGIADLRDRACREYASHLVNN